MLSANNSAENRHPPATGLQGSTPAWHKQVQRQRQVQQFPALVSHTWERIIHHSSPATRIDWPESLSPPSAKSQLRN